MKARYGFRIVVRKCGLNVDRMLHFGGTDRNWRDHARAANIRRFRSMYGAKATITVENWDE